MNKPFPLYRRGQIWWVKLDPSFGVEAAKTKACLILQNDAGNQTNNITTIVSFLAKKNYLFVVNVSPSPQNGLDRERGLHFNQIRSVDSSRIVSQLGILESQYWSKIETALDVQLGFF
jgi:mRNA interferase MazF